jgi:aerobic-type carbon monoxide dehydrogenase small subunit (CoxS/CutS family)
MRDPEMPLLWALRDLLKLTGTKYGCGVAACGACTVTSTVSPCAPVSHRVSSVANAKIATIESLGVKGDHPVQRAWIELDVVQCGYCQSGQIMSAVALRRVERQSDRRRHRRRDGRQHLSLWHLSAASVRRSSVQAEIKRNGGAA